MKFSALSRRSSAFVPRLDPARENIRERETPEAQEHVFHYRGCEVRVETSTDKPWLFTARYQDPDGTWEYTGAFDEEVDAACEKAQAALDELLPAFNVR